MAGVPGELGEPRATARPVVLPITARGLALTDRACWVILSAAMLAAAGLILYLNRGTTFYVDEVRWLFTSTDFELREVLDRDNGHLVATTRLAYKAILETFGANYVAIRLLAVCAVLLAAGLFYALVKRRIGAVAALAPTLVLLFFGSGWQHVVVPIGFTVAFAIAAGLAALLALERRNRVGDVAACALLILALATYSIGVAFLAGVALSVALRPDRWRRAWIFLIPLALYGAWWLWSPGWELPTDAQVKSGNVLLIPAYIAESLSVVSAAVTGLDYDFGASPAELELGWGRILAALAVVAFALRIRRRSVPASLWVSLGILLTLWALGALVVGPSRDPTQVRYIYPGAVAVLLVAASAASGIRFSRLGLAALFGAVAVSLATNIALLRDAAALYRDEYSSPVRAQFAMLELARFHLDPGFDPVASVPEAAPNPKPHVLGPALLYLATAQRFGSPAYSLPEVERQSETVRQGADQVLAGALRLRLQPSRPGAASGEACRRIPAAGQGVTFELPTGGASIRARSAAPASVAVGRFASYPSAGLGDIAPGETVTLRIPPDESARPWHASVAGATAVTVCGLR